MRSEYKFLVVGGANTAITFALYALLVKQGLNYNLAMTSTYVMGIVLGFSLNRIWTFSHNDGTGHDSEIDPNSKSARTQFSQYLLVYLLIYVVNFLILNLLVQAFGLHPIVSQLIAVGVSTVCSFFLQKSWVFNR